MKASKKLSHGGKSFLILELKDGSNGLITGEKLQKKTRYQLISSFLKN
jgi:hypothetical protein